MSPAHKNFTAKDLDLVTNSSSTLTCPYSDVYISILPGKRLVMSDQAGDYGRGGNRNQ